MKNNVGQLTVFFVVFLLTLHFVAPAEETQENACGFHARDEQIVLPYIPSPPRIDGIFEEEIYRDFLKLGNFFQVSPKYNQPGSEKSEAFLGCDDKNIYLAVKAYTGNPQKIRASVARRDSIENDDRIELILDTFVTRQRGFAFAVNPYGVQMDGIFDEAIDEVNMDKSWDAQFFSGGHIYDWGYFVEMKIPFKSLRFPREKDIQGWGFNITRFIQDNQEMDFLFYWDRTDRSWMSQEGKLIIGAPIKPGLHLEWVPYISTLKNKNEDLKLNSGFSFKYGINTDATLDLTYNPDFSHIEADAWQINVNQRYALYFEEKRPFFLEGKEIFKTPLELFYSRRVAVPRFGAKVTGKTGKSSFGLFSAYDTASFRSVWDVPEGGEEKAFATVFRYKYEFRKENYFGLLITDKRGEERSYNSIIGLDAHLKHKNFIGDFQAVTVKTDQEDKITQQEKKATGQAYYGSFSYADEHLQASVFTEQYSPEFDAQLGFINRVDMKRYGARLGYNFLPEKSYFVLGGPRINYEYITDWKGGVQDKCLMFKFVCRTYKNTMASVFLEKNFERYKGVDYDKNLWGFNIQSAPFKYLAFSAFVTFGDGVHYGDNPYPGYRTTVMFTSTFLPAPRISILTDWTSEYFYRSKGEEVAYKINIYRVKLTYLFNRNLSVRTIWEFNDLEKKYYSDVLLAYEYTPGTVFYLGYSSDAIKEGTPGKINKFWLGKDSYSIYFKFSYFFKK
ncbi:MAG: DUF5916 domain-containing protein [Candidatus Aminicenantes bacterium]|nr:DUF5916 domain-containing protein [Candidatus Aminicenantes bacterium]